MFTLRCTHRLLERLAATPASTDVTPTTVLGDWYAGIVPFRSPLALFMNERTLLAVLQPVAPAVTLLARFPPAVAALLERLGVPPHAIAAELESMATLQVGATANRRVLGCLNEATQMLRLLGVAPNESARREAEDRLALTIYSSTGDRHPTDAVAELFALPGRRPVHALH